MRLKWEIGPRDVDAVRAFVARWSGSGLVVERRRRNLATEKPKVTRDLAWCVHIACLLTSQQASGPNDPAKLFMDQVPFPLSVETCERCETLASNAVQAFLNFGGIRRYNVIADAMVENLPHFCGAGWEACHAQLEHLRLNQSLEAERQVARFFAQRIHEFGPKQSRNFLQMLGLTRFEIPLDSRVTGWLREFGLNLPINSRLLLDTDYYEFLEDGIRELCRASDIFPCVLDAAVFASYDPEGSWTSENSSW